MSNRFGCYLRFRANQSITGVTICIFIAFSEQSAYDFFGDRPQRKNSGWYVKELTGDKRREYTLIVEGYE